MCACQSIPPPVCPSRPLPSPYPTPLVLHLCLLILFVCLVDCGWSLPSRCNGHIIWKGLKTGGGVRKHFPMEGVNAMWLALRLILWCHVIFSVRESLPKRNRQRMPARAVTAIYPLLPICASIAKRFPAVWASQFRLSTDCPSSQITHQLISESNFFSSVDGW